MIVKKCNAEDRKHIVTERMSSCNDTGEIFYYISKVIIICYAASPDNTSIFMTMNYHLGNECVK